ncbi:MAG: hypothetical protein COY66_02060 [Candidatus Kerfeldbacteria bacterium CG_4_10_14_0_8_um_filter_42_10]|uniref:Nudix hydrolase domain-containing protein n=1 Tax=Candidatus Kerfeldbacteria bacterium CG_4_10_14_0_8_um_filter_42_10 TaxID=2014248 RepID=A0A2M7RJP7_9BACT|nr:MAG: hypothetical protein COY66_02060 [Candidatus Kerfeldbacteria bacterium CG_4_10_14_0_8_um_filter_42_10]
MKPVKNIEIILRAIIVNSDKILLCVSNDQPPIHYLPGGHLEYGETLEECLKREIKEEVGAVVKTSRFMETFENFFKWRGENHHEINLLYEVTLKTVNPEKIKCQESHISITWLAVSAIPKSRLLPASIHQYLIKYFNH